MVPRTLQNPLQGTPAWKHSQYFFKHPLFLQLHPLLWRPTDATPSPSCGGRWSFRKSEMADKGKVQPPRTSEEKACGDGWTFGRKAFGLRSKVASTASCGRERSGPSGSPLTPEAPGVTAAARLSDGLIVLVIETAVAVAPDAVVTRGEAFAVPASRDRGTQS